MPYYDFGNVKIFIERDYDAMSDRASTILRERVAAKPESLLTIATGSSPEGLYTRFRDIAERGVIDTGALRFHKLDEWLGLSMNDPGSCDSYIRKHLLEPLGIRDNQYWGVDGKAEDPAAECRRISARLASEGPADICILGMGANGHLGLNEPGDFIEPYTHVVKLTPESMNHGMLNAAKVPVALGLTTGMAEILRSEFILFPVSGRGKSEQLRQFATRRITTRFPASFLWLHKHVCCICDEDSAAGVENWEV